MFHCVFNYVISGHLHKENQKPVLPIDDSTQLRNSRSRLGRNAVSSPQCTWNIEHWTQLPKNNCEIVEWTPTFRPTHLSLCSRRRALEIIQSIGSQNCRFRKKFAWVFSTMHFIHIFAYIAKTMPPLWQQFIEK